jgi:uncharacterized protein
MPATLRHLAINADDVQRAKTFYEAVFGWRFEPWGPPDYYQAREAGEGFVKATLAVDDIGATTAAIVAAGGRMVSREYYIESVGRLAYFEDPAGNLLGAMQYDAPPP